MRANLNVYSYKAASLRASGGKEAIARAVRRKRRKDPKKNRRGKAKNVSNKLTRATILSQRATKNYSTHKVLLLLLTNLKQSNDTQ